jgi:hypothetical protein
MTTQHSATRTRHPEARSHDIEKYGSGYLRVRREIADYPTMTFRYEEVGGGYLNCGSWIVGCRLRAD